MSKEARMDAMISFYTESLKDFAEKFVDVVIEDGKVSDAEYIEKAKKPKRATCKIKR